MMLIRIIFWFSLVAIFTGCQTYNGSIDRNRPTYTPPVDSIIELHQPLSVYPGYSRSFIQFGKALKASELNQRYPWCQFRLYEPASALETERSIQPDRFLVTQSNRRMENVASNPRVLASSILLINMLDDDPSDQYLSSIMRIQSETQPQVFEFKCSIYTEPRIYNYVTINEMQQALGDVATIRLPAQ